MLYLFCNSELQGEIINQNNNEEDKTNRRTERQTDIHTENTDRQTDRHTLYLFCNGEIQAERVKQNNDENEKRTDGQTYKQTDRHINRQIDREDRQTDRQMLHLFCNGEVQAERVKQNNDEHEKRTDGQTYKQTDRHINRQIDKEDRQTDRHTLYLFRNGEVQGEGVKQNDDENEKFFGQIFPRSFFIVPVSKDYVADEETWEKGLDCFEMFEFMLMLINLL